MKKYIALGFKIIVSFILLYLILDKLGVAQLVKNIVEGKLEFLCLGLLIGLLCNIIKIAKWSYLTGSVHKYSFWVGFQSYTLGFCFGLLTPLRAGELGRALFYSKEYFPQIISLTVLDRGLDIIAVMILSIAGSFLLIGNLFGIVIILSVVILIVFLYRFNVFVNILKKILPSKWLRKSILDFINHTANLNKKYISFSMGLSLLAFTLSVIELYFFVYAFDDVSMKAVALSIPLMSLSNLLPISIMGIGVREGVAFILLSKFNVSGYASVSAAFLSFVVNNLLLSAIGALFVSKISFSKSEIPSLSL